MLVRSANGPKADEQVRTQAHDFPKDEQLEQIRGNHQTQHSAREKRDVSKEPRVTRIVGDVMMSLLVGVAVLHIADAVDEDHQADCRHHKQRHRRERINHPADKEK